MIIPLIKKQFIDKKQAFSFDDLMEMSAVAQSAPGAIAINLAAITGYKIAGIPGAVISCIAAILPPLLIISAIASCYEQFIQNHYLNAAFKGMLSAANGQTTYDNIGLKQPKQPIKDICILHRIILWVFFTTLFTMYQALFLEIKIKKYTIMLFFYFYVYYEKKFLFISTW